MTENVEMNNVEIYAEIEETNLGEMINRSQFASEIAIPSISALSPNNIGKRKRGLDYKLK